MPRITAKICGLSTADSVGAAVRHGASHVGFVFFPKSPRHVNTERMQALAAFVPGHVSKVAVLVDPDDALLASVAPLVDILQLHGSETPERVAAAARATGREVWKAVSVRTRADLATAPAWRGAAQRILYDAKPPAGADLPGGLGLRFDWTLLSGFDHPLPWALSGGIDIDNVARAVSTTGARLVDISSGVETAPGVKDVDKIAAFLKAVAIL
ncbi:phosphoribosylanthranilate isomerase [Sphingomonas zeicaulis]|uniref:phosphoribosylanthranilate isomerase n=1 Tax=Sphingomonas zeicaulis TaxID=1632740 RepID=UPI003D2427A0